MPKPDKNKKEALVSRRLDGRSRHDLKISVDDDILSSF